MSYKIASDELSITCNNCGFTSHNRNDVKHKFCGMCLVFHDDVKRVYTSELELPLRVSVLIAAKAASELFKLRGRIASPIWHGVKSSGDTVFIPRLVPDRDMQLLMLRSLFIREDVVRYTVVSEAWFARVRTSKPRRGDATKHPDRIEILHIHGEDTREGKLTARRDITRDKRGAPKLGPLLMGGEEYIGAMYDLLPHTTH